MLQKTYTVDFITKKKIKNDGYVKRYYIKNNHEPIISRQQYYMVQEELKRRKAKMSSGSRFSSKYPLSGLLVCGECGSSYIRVTWYEDRKKKNKKAVPVWRCSEKLKTGTKKCKSSPSLKEDNLYGQLINQMRIIIDAEISSSSAPLLQTKALIANLIGENKVVNSAMTKTMWDSMVEKIVIEGKAKAVVHFKTGIIQEMTLY